MDFFIKYQSPWKKHHVEIMREEYRKIAESYVRWMDEGDKVSITKLDDMIGAYMSKFKLDKVRMVRDYAYSIDVNGDIYPYASAVGNKKLLLGNVVTGEETQAMSTLEKAGMVESCRNCCINDACVASKGNEITDDLVPRAYPIACASYKFAFDAADYIVNARLDNYKKGTSKAI
jgi:sulfatase maturation enzyme AslB (radical SAM superfamily)